VDSARFVYLVDSLAQSMSASISDANIDSIRYRVWRLLRSAEAWPAGSFGNYLDAAITTISGAGGNGDYLCSLLVLDTSKAPDEPVVGAKVRVKSGATLVAGPVYTSAAGWATVFLDAGSYNVFAGAHLVFQQSAPYVLTVSGAMKDTVPTRSFIPSPPPGVDSCNVILFTDAPGCVATFEPPSQNHQDTTGNGLNTRIVRVPDDDADGIIQLALPRTAATRKASKYNIELRNGAQNSRLIYRVTEYIVPNQTSDTLMVPK
jgi:hypothetical protein